MPRTRQRAIAAVEPMPAPAPSDRRQHRRIAIQRAGKLHHPNTDRYVGVDTLNVSRGGALLRLDERDAPRVGERVLLGVAWDGETILDDESMQSATVLRVSASAPAPTVALRFTSGDPLPPHIAARA